MRLSLLPVGSAALAGAMASSGRADGMPAAVAWKTVTAAGMPGRRCPPAAVPARAGCRGLAWWPGAARGRSGSGGRLEPVDGFDYGKDEDGQGYCAVEVPDSDDNYEADCAGKREENSEGNVASDAGVEEKNVGKEGGISREIGWEFFHGVRSLAASAMAVGVAIAIDIFNGAGVDWKWVLAVPGIYFVAVVSTWTGDRWLFRRGQALLPPDRYGGGRTVVTAAAMVFYLSGEPAGAALAGWAAVSAVLVGGVADGSWIAIVGKRNGLGFWRAWRELLFREKEARKWCWQSLFGEGRR